AHARGRRRGSDSGDRERRRRGAGGPRAGDRAWPCRRGACGFGLPLRRDHDRGREGVPRRARYRDAAVKRWLDEVAWNAEGLVPAVAQDATSHEVLMVAWMNRESLERTVESGEAVYWSRSRKALWKKGETSGHVQRVREIRLDCDGDTLVLQVE